MYRLYKLLSLYGVQQGCRRLILKDRMKLVLLQNLIIDPGQDTVVLAQKPFQDVLSLIPRARFYLLAERDL